jgi:predicted Zn-dependent peptidase
VTLDDLLRVAEEYLQPEKASFGLITQSANKDELNVLGFDVHEL